jgi:tRNA nucleotidyltransferase/poly(A) polymerase
MSNLEKQISEARSHEELDALLHQGPSNQRAPRHEAAAEPTTATPSTDLTKRLSEARSRDEIDQILHEAKPAEPATFSRTEKIGGKDFTFEAASELELERAVQGALRVAAELQPPAPVVDYVQAGRDAAVRFAERADLELRYKRNEVSTQEYLEQSGAVKDYLENQGIPLDELRQTVEETRHKAFEQSWADATTTFLQSGVSWPGGERNKQILGLKLQELGLIDATDKVAAISQAYAAMKKDNLIFANDAARPRDPDGRYAAAAPPDLDRATPSELLEAWKSAQPSAEAANKTFSALFGKGR